MTPGPSHDVRLGRREFLTGMSGLAGTAAGAALLHGMPSAGAAASDESASPRPVVAAFTKSFQDWSIPEVCRRFREIGLDGLDLTVRPGGHIAPEDAPQQLPRAAAAAREHGLSLVQLTTGVTAADPVSERLFAAAAEVGVTRLKLGYYRYSEFGTLRAQLDAVRRQLEGVVTLGEKHAVHPCVHVHSGRYIPASGHSLYELLRSFDPVRIGAYVDMLHMSLEGGGDGWRQGIDLLAPWISLCAVKNYALERSGLNKDGQQQWSLQVCPLADGISPIPQFVAALRQVGYRGPYSLHSEYQGSHSFRDLSAEGCLAQTSDDLRYFRRLLEA